MKKNHLITEINHGKNCQYSKQNKGFTLIELLIAMFVGLIVLGAIYAVFIAQNKELNKQEQIAVMQQNARMAIDMMTREIMMAGYGATNTLPRCSGTTTATNTPCVGITAANTNSISFTMDVSDGSDGIPDGDYDDANENITYDLYTSDSVPALGRKSSTTANKQPVVENVSTLAFTYCPATGSTCDLTNATSTLENIRRIQISITTRTANIDPNTGIYRYYNLVSIVTPRNLGLTGY